MSVQFRHCEPDREPLMLEIRDGEAVLVEHGEISMSRRSLAWLVVVAGPAALALLPTEDAAR